MSVNRSRSRSKGTDSQHAELPSFVDWNGGDAVRDNDKKEAELRQTTLEVNNETDFDLDEVPDRLRNRYKRMDQHQRDCWWAHVEYISMSEDVDEQFKRHLAHSYAKELGMNDLLTQRVLRWFLNYQLGGSGIRSELVLFGICLHVIEEEAEERYSDGKSPYHPNRNDENNDVRFQTVVDDLVRRFGRLHTGRITSIYNQLGSQHRSSYYTSEQEVAHNSTRRQSHDPEKQKATMPPEEIRMNPEAWFDCP